VEVAVKMGQVKGRIVVETHIMTTVCQSCGGLHVALEGKPHVCDGLKKRWSEDRVVVVLSKHETTVNVTCAE
jgi:hypothetical protein